MNETRSEYVEGLRAGAAALPRRCDRLVFDDDVVAQLAVAFGSTPPEQLQPLGFLRGCLDQLEGHVRKENLRTA